MQTVFYDPFEALSGARRERRVARAEYLKPAVDIVESAQDYQLLLELPGVDSASIEVTLERDQLIVVADKQRPQLSDGEALTRSERSLGRYRRQFTLPEDADAESVNADSKNGVLTLVISKRQPEQARRKIEITA